MKRADLKIFEGRCLDRATTTTRGDYTELTIEAGAYLVQLGFNSQTLDVINSDVSERPERPRVAAPEFEGESGTEMPVDQWEAAGQFLADGVSFGKAVLSKTVQGPVTGAKLDYRVMCCFGKTISGEQINEPCPSMVTKDENNYCRSCGCGTNRKRARLNPQTDQDWNTSKLAYPYLKCPLGRFGPVNGSRKDEKQ